nr:MAG TPA: hypothetical protein [Caudoviricetes sp.]
MRAVGDRRAAPPGGIYNIYPMILFDFCSFTGS